MDGYNSGPEFGVSKASDPIKSHLQRIFHGVSTVHLELLTRQGRLSDALEDAHTCYFK